MKNYDVLDELIPKTQELHRAIFDKGYEQGQADVLDKIKVAHCKKCKNFDYDHVENVSGIPLIMAHEICLRWGDGCKTKEDGYCFLFEPQESEVNNG